MENQQNPFEIINDYLRQINNKIDDLKKHQIPLENPSSDEFLNIEEAAQFLNLAKATIYSLTSTCQIPVIKKRKRLYFSKAELIIWVNKGRRKTTEEIELEASNYVSKKSL